MANDWKNNRTQEIMSKKRIITNIAVMSIGTFALFTAYDGPTMLQSSMNKKEGIGVKALAINYACFCLSALLFPKYFIKRFGSKYTFIFSMILYLPYIASNYYPHWAVMVPVSVCIGFSAALLWSSQATYLNDVSVMLAMWSNLESSSKDSSHDASFGDDYSGNSCCQICSTATNKSENNKNGSKNNEKAGVVPPKLFQIKPSTSHTNVETTPNSSSRHNQELSKKEVETITARVFGIYGTAFFLSTLCGNLLAYFILKRDIDVPTLYSNSTCACGARYCNTVICLNNNSEEVSDNTRNILTTVCVSLAVVSVVIVALFLEPLENEMRVPLSLEFLTATYRITKDRSDLILIMPYTLYLGQIKGFFTGEFTKVFVSCAWGTYHVPLVSISYGVICALFATCSGWIVKFLGRMPLFTFAALLNIGSSVLLLLWKPSPQHSALFFVAAGMIGAFVGIIWSQLRAFYGVLFKADEEAAFGAFYVWYSIGYALSFAYSTFFCTYVKIYILLCVSSIGFIGYFIVEKRFSALI